MYSLEVLSTADDLAALAPEWAAAAASSGNPLMRPDWSLACARAWGDDSTPAVHVLRHHGEVAAVAPLRSTATRPSRLTTLWDRTGEHPELFHRDASALEELCTRLLSLRETLTLPHLDLKGPAMRLLSDGVRGRGTTVVDHPRQATWVPFRRDWATFESSLSASYRSWLRRKRRKLDQHGAVHLEVVDPAPDEVAQHVARLAEIERAGWKGRAGTAIAQDPWQQRFLVTYAPLAAARGAIRFYFLCVSGEPVAAQMYAVDGGRLWQLKIGYDEQWADCSPGVLLMHEVLRHGHDEGLEGCECLGRAEPWQLRWPVVLREHARLRIYPANLRGGVDLARDTTGRAWHRARDAAQRSRGGR